MLLVNQLPKFIRVCLLLGALAASAFFVNNVDAASHPTTTLNRFSIGLHSGPEWGYHVTGKLFQHQELTVEARTGDSKWALVRVGQQRGWISAENLRISTRTLNTAPVHSYSLPGAKIKPTAAIAKPRMGIHTGPAAGYNVTGLVFGGQQVITMARSEDSKWVFIWSDEGDGWVSTKGLYDFGAFGDLPVWKKPMANSILKPTAMVWANQVSIHSGAGWNYDVIAQLSQADEPIILGRNQDGTWVFVWSDQGDGWVPANALCLEFDFMNTLQVWDTAMNSAKFVTTAKVRNQRLSLRSAPRHGSYVIHNLVHDEMVSVLGRSITGDWLFVATEKGNGWVHTPMMKTNSNLRWLPVQ